MEEINCIFCNTGNHRVVIEENGYTGRKCFQCGLIYISPRPSLDEILVLYSHDNAHISARSHISGEFSKRLAARHNLKFVTSYSKRGSILEIGAGAGYFLDEAKKLGFDPYGIEFNSVQAIYIREQLHIPCEESPVSESAFKGIQFDIVYHCDVISHFFDPFSEFKNIHQRMKEGGILLFETGNLGEVKQKYFKYFKRFQYPDHLFFFSPDNLIELLEKTGFECIRIYRYSILPQLIALNAYAFARNSLKNGIKKYKQPENRSEDNTDTKSLSGKYLQSGRRSDSILKKSFRFLYSCSEYLLRYKIGYLVPKTHRPQTLIIVARKRP